MMRGAHMLFRQMRFPIDSVPQEAMDRALDDARFLGEAADAPGMQKGRAKAKDR